MTEINAIRALVVTIVVLGMIYKLLYDMYFGK